MASGITLSHQMFIQRIARLFHDKPLGLFLPGSCPNNRYLRSVVAAAPRARATRLLALRFIPAERPAWLDRAYCQGRIHRYRRRQVKTEDIAKFQTEPTTAPATPASHQAWLEVNA